MQEAEIKKTRHWLWLLPILAMLVALYLAYKSISNLGSEITIELASANGLEAGRTKIRYRSLEVGTVSEISLTPDFQRVIIHAQMKRMAEPLLRSDSEFWVVKPQIGIDGIKGLNTLLSGNFIAISPGKSKTYSSSFKGLDQSPLIPNTIAGVRVYLEAETNAGLNVGSAIYYRGFRVGRIDYLNFNEDFSKIKAQAFIFAPYDQLINSKTKFYNASGLDFKLGMRGLEVNMPSLETVVLGGLAIKTEKSKEPFFPETTLFKVYNSAKELIEQPNYKKANYAIRFNESVKGLKIGSMVEFQGIELGRVSDIKLIYDDNKNLAIVSIILEIEYERMKSANSEIDKNSLNNLIENGLFATLETANFVSGEKLIRLNMQPSNKQILAFDEYSSYPLIPSQESGLNNIIKQSNKILQEINDLNFKELVERANQTLQSLEKTAKELELASVGKNLNKSLTSVSRAANSVEKMMNSLKKEIPSLSKQFKHTMQSIDSESNIYFKFNKTLEDLSRMAQGISRLMRQLDAKPNSMIFGK